MTPHEQQLVAIIHDAAADVVASLERQHVPHSTAFAIAFEVAITFLERMPHDTRAELAAALIARITTARHLDA